MRQRIRLGTLQEDQRGGEAAPGSRPRRLSAVFRMVLTDGQSHDVTVGRTLTFQPGTIVAMDKGYVDYLWWKLGMSESGVYFVVRV